MDYRSVALRETGWGGVVVALASIGLVACNGSGGSGGCPQLSGSWVVNGSCVDTAGISCEIDQDENSCSITLSCSDGRTLMGSVSKGSVSFRDEEVSCSGRLEGLEDEGAGFINPTIDGSCMPTGGEMCDIDARCQSGNCTIPEDEDEDNDEGDSGAGGSAGVFAGSGGASGTSGQGGSSGVFGGGSGEGGEGGSAGTVAGSSGEGGSAGVFAGTGGISGEGGAGGTGPAIDVEACVSCVDSNCQTELSTCTEANGCLPALTCTIGSGCSQDDVDCIVNACQGSAMFTPDGETAANNVSACMAENCLSPCVSSGPVAGSGGAGGIGGEGGVGGVPPGPGGCTDDCQYPADGDCDDGGPGADFSACLYGTDCTDCGPREPGSGG